MLFDYGSATKNPRVLLSCELTDNHSHYKVAITFSFCWFCLSLSLLNSSQLLSIPSPFTKAACTFSSSSKVRCNRAVNMGPSPGWNFSCLLPSKTVNKMRALRRLHHGPWGKKFFRLQYMLSEEGMESCHRHQDYFCDIYKIERKISWLRYQKQMRDLKGLAWMHLKSRCCNCHYTGFLCSYLQKAAEEGVFTDQKIF